MIYSKPLPTSKRADRKWAERVQRAVERLIARYGDNIEFVGVPAEQWLLAQSILFPEGV